MGTQIVRSTGKIKTSAQIAGSVFHGCDLIKGTTTITLTIYDSGANTGNVLFQASNSASALTDTIEMADAGVSGVGKLWAEIAGTQANVVIRYR